MFTISGFLLLIVQQIAQLSLMHFYGKLGAKFFQTNFTSQIRFILASQTGNLLICFPTEMSYFLMKLWLINSLWIGFQ